MGKWGIYVAKSQEERWKVKNYQATSRKNAGKSTCIKQNPRNMLENQQPQINMINNESTGPAIFGETSCRFFEAAIGIEVGWDILGFSNKEEQHREIW